MKLTWLPTMSGKLISELPFFKLVLLQDPKGWFYDIYNSNSQLVSSSITLSRFETKEDVEKACIESAIYICQQQIETLQRMV